MILFFSFFLTIITGKVDQLGNKTHLVIYSSDKKLKKMLYIYFQIIVLRKCVRGWGQNLLNARPFYV